MRKHVRLLHRFGKNKITKSDAGSHRARAFALTEILEKRGNQACVSIKKEKMEMFL